MSYDQREIEQLHNNNMQHHRSHVPIMAPYGQIIAPPPNHHHHHLMILYSQLVYQINYYFSHDNLVKDLYLRRHMDEQGWVPLNVIAKFPRVRILTWRYKIIEEALRGSTEIEIKFFMWEYKIRKRHDWERYIIKTPN